MVVWLVLALAGVAVFVVAAVAVGRETFRLGHQIPASIFDLDEAVDHVAEALPVDAQARLTHDEVRVLIAAHVDYLHDKGVVGRYGRDPDVVAAEQDTPELVIADEETLAFVLGRVDTAGLEVSDDDAYAVMAALHHYLSEIGAVGPRAEGGL